ncbi:hypothetical protein H0H92_003655 [Tricholoma furcatifolium]|nr:hypothetical protein H0H92_003655 [Tricholoma furcatifolium]
MYKFRSLRARFGNLIRHTDIENGSHVDLDDLPKTIMRARRRQPLLGFVSRNSGYIFFGCVFVLFMRAGFFAGNNSLQSDVYSQDYDLTTTLLPFSEGGWLPTSVSEHPIPKLMDEAEEQHRQKLAGQSKTLRAAVAEYKRRYKRPPPKGFDRWWKFAQKHGVKFVDEYDGLISDLAPFWELKGEELRRRAEQVGELPSIDIVRIRNGEATAVNLNSDFEDSETSARAHGFRDMLAKFVHSLKGAFSFRGNIEDIQTSLTKIPPVFIFPRVNTRIARLTYHVDGIQAVLNGPFRPDWGDDGTVWEAWRRTCDPKSAARRVFSSLRNNFSPRPKNYLSTSSNEPGSDFNFASATHARTLNFCQAPHEHYTQGHFFSDWRTIHALYPVFSPARAKGFLDIRIPSHYYYGSTKRYTYGWDPINLEQKEVDNMEMPWAEKEDKIFWRGATTGGGSHPPGFSPQYQRHRFLRLASDTSSTPRTITFANPPSSKHYTSASVPVSSLNAEIMDTAFVKAVSPESYPGGMKALAETHRFGDSVPLGRHWAYKYLVDLDGMSYSGRFMSFLASDSVPVKATVYEEYFSDWIQPCEIYNIYAYFSGPPRAALEAINSTLLEHPAQNRRSVEGDRRLRRIARAGKEWKKTVGRTIDMEDSAWNGPGFGRTIVIP